MHRASLRLRLREVQGFSATSTQAHASSRPSWSWHVGHMVYKCTPRIHQYYAGCNASQQVTKINTQTRIWRMPIVHRWRPHFPRHWVTGGDAAVVETDANRDSWVRPTFDCAIHSMHRHTRTHTLTHAQHKHWSVFACSMKGEPVNTFEHAPRDRARAPECWSRFFK